MSLRPHGTRAGWLALAAVVPAAGLALAWALGVGSGTPLERARAAYARGDWRGAERLARRHLGREPRDLDADAVLARSLARQDRNDEARPHFLRVEPASLTSEDLYLVGRGLVGQGRTALGWGALDAAAKLDPSSRPPADALADLHRRIESLGAAVGPAERLTAVPDGRALGVLVMGLLAMDPKGPPERGFDAALDHVASLDRGTLVKVRTPDAARKLLARFLLEDGRPADARARLARVSNAASDPETQWLLSRAWLDEGQVDAAVKALERARDFGGSATTREPSPYAGAKSCADCHGANYRTQQSGFHAKTVASGPALKDVPLPKADVRDPVRADVVHHFERTATGVTVEARVGNETVRAVAAYAMGSGHRGQTLLARDADGDVRSLRISLYSGGDHWDLTSGVAPRPPDAASYLGPALADAGFRACLNCHMTRFRSEADRNGPEAADHGIGCERCHGPSQRHLKAVEAGFPQLAVARPKGATHAEKLALCAPCHGDDGTIPASDPRYVRFQATTFPFSRCYTEGGGFDCVSCHNPHRNHETDPAYYEARCLACHGPGAPSKDPALRLDAVAAGRCKAGKVSGCVGCHMPRAENVVPFTSFTDHHIRVHRGAAAPAAGGEGCR